MHLEELGHKIAGDNVFFFTLDNGRRRWSEREKSVRLKGEKRSREV